MRNIIPLNFKNRVGIISSKVSLFILACLFTGSTMQAQSSYTVDKIVVGVEESATAGNINILYQVTFSNVSEAMLTNIQIVDDAEASIGASFVGVASMPSFVATTATINPILNLGYTGDVVDPNMLDGISGMVVLGESFTLAYSIEIDPALAVGDIANTVTASGDNGLGIVFPLPTSTSTLQNCWSNCALACNNQVNISVNTMCEAEIFANMILEGEDEECADLGFYKVEIFDQNGNPVALPIPSIFIGQKLRVIITNIACGNTCWSNLLVEDKIAPNLNCDEVTVDCNESISPYNPLIGFPVSLANITATNDPYKFIASSVDACGNVYLEYQDSLVLYDCNNPDLSSTIYRKWTATDASGLMVICWDTINFIRGTIADITLPPHYDGIGGNEPVLECDDDFCRLPNGFPAPDSCGTGAPQGLFCGNIQFDYWDDTIHVCDGTYKLFRTWLIIDWCDPDNKVEYVQRIKVVDHDGPLVVPPPRETLILTMDGWNCNKASYLVPEPVFDTSGAHSIAYPYVPNILEECSSWTYEVQSLSVGTTIKDPDDCAAVALGAVFNTYNVRRITSGPNAGRYELFDIPAGCNWIKYIITDDCGNSTIFAFDIFIEDNVDPITVCHDHTVVSLTSDGKARVNASTFDDGSHDNCGIGRMEVRRMREGNCPFNVLDDRQFRDFVEFCCEDIADNPIMVILRVYDECGNNWSECMVEVTVQDKLPPIITYCPDSVTIYCEDNYSPLSQFGTAEAFDNCNVVMTDDADFQLNTCGVGVIIRTFTATDDGGRTATCSQVITIEDKNPFVKDDIIWPPNITLNNGCEDDTHPDNTGWPIYLNEDRCNKIATSYEDLVFSQVSGSCLKILRQWKVLDWCQFDRNHPDDCFPINKGKWCYTQIIKVNDNEGPSFTSDCNDRSICIDGPGCEVRATLEATAFDSCTPSNLLTWSYELDLNNNGSIDASGNRSSFSRNYTEGKHRITWFVQDQCGNVEECSYVIDVQDCKKPTPYCKIGITTVVMPTTANIELWAIDFDEGSFDNCTDTSDLTFSFSADRNEKNKVFDCLDIKNGRSDTIEVTIYVWDNNGNHDFCITSLILQDPQDVCPDVANAGGMISGLIANLNAGKMKAVEVSIESPSMQSSKIFQTDDNGKFTFPSMSKYENYVVKPSLNEDHLNGISTLDLVMIQRHLLGLESFNSPYMYIAADVNNSESVSAGDISELRKLILGKYSELPNNNSWRFIDKLYQFPEPNDPFPYKEEIRIEDLRGDMIDNDFMAVKIGDVSGDAEASGARSNKTRNGSIVLETDDALISGENVIVPVTMADVNMHSYGMQFTLQYNASMLTFKAIESGSLIVNESNLAIISRENGLITFSWFSPEGVYINIGDVLFNLAFESRDATFTSDWISINSDITDAQMYDTEGNTYDIVWRRSQSTIDGYVLHQNTPNPFKGVTNIGFELPSQIEYRLEIFDMSGKNLNVIEGLGQKGYQSIEIDLSGFSKSSVLYYQLNTDAFTATKKMVIIE